MTAEQKLRKLRDNREHELARKRQQILDYLKRRPNASIEQITVAVGYKYGLRDLLSTLQRERLIEERGGAWSLASAELEEEVEADEAAKPEQLRGGRGRTPRRDQLVALVTAEPGLTTQQLADRLQISTKAVHITCRAAELHAVPVARRPGPRGLIREIVWYPRGAAIPVEATNEEVPHGLTTEPSQPALGPEPSVPEGSSASSTAGGQPWVDPDPEEAPVVSMADLRALSELTGPKWFEEHKRLIAIGQESQVQRQLVEAQARILKLQRDLELADDALNIVGLVDSVLEELLGADRLGLGIRCRLGILLERVTTMHDLLRKEAVGG
jgi:hypothetical protein